MRTRNIIIDREEIRFYFRDAWCDFLYWILRLAGAESSYSCEGVKDFCEQVRLWRETKWRYFYELECNCANQDNTCGCNEESAPF